MKPEFDKSNKTGTGSAYNKEKTQGAPLSGGKQQQGTRPMGNVTQKTPDGGSIDRTNLGNLGNKDKTDKR